jgi:hypothetical protein
MDEPEPAVNPMSFAVLTACVVGILVLLIFASIGASYLLMVNYIHHIEAEQAAQSLGTCKALIGLDNAKDGIKFSPPTSSGTAELYVLRFTESLHRVIVATGCDKLVKQ